MALRVESLCDVLETTSLLEYLMFIMEERLQRVTDAAPTHRLGNDHPTALAEFEFEETGIVSITIVEQDLLFAGRMQIVAQLEPDTDKGLAATFERTRIVPPTILEQDLLFARRMFVPPHPDT
jgi:hypothetical protein